MNEIGKRIKKIREERKLKQSDIAKIIGKSTATVTHIENGEHNGTFKILKDICTELNVSADYVLGLDAEQDELKLSGEGIKLLEEYKKFLKEKYPKENLEVEKNYTKAGNL